MTLLLLAGTNEAKRIAWGLVDTGISLRASLAGATRKPDPLPFPTRIGGFGGEEGFRAYLADKKITAVLDATHPFAHHITERTARVCRELALDYAQVLRPPWEASRNDTWIDINAPKDVAAQIPQTATVFLATGRMTLPQYSNLEGRRVLARMIDPPSEPFPFAGGEFVLGRPPFSPQSETELFKALGVTHLVVKNSGGLGGSAKLDAARRLKLPVFMIKRPPMPDAFRVASVDEALFWATATGPRQ